MVYYPWNALAPAMDTEASRAGLWRAIRSTAVQPPGAAGIATLPAVRYSGTSIINMFSGDSCNQFWSCTAVATKCSAGTPTANEMAACYESFSKRLKRRYFFMVFSKACANP